MQLLYQTRLSSEHIKEAHRLLCEFHLEFEDLYVQRREERIHFLRQSIHLLTHIAPETLRAGPLSCYAQWTMETAIGNLGDEIRQDKDPYANIAQRGVLRAQMNSLIAIMPQLLLRCKDNTNHIPTGAIPILGADGYVLLRACQLTLVDVSATEAAAIMELWSQNNWPNQNGWPHAVRRWARLRLPNGQIARSLWMESRSQQSLRKTSIIKFHDGNTYNFAEVQYFFRLKFGEIVHTLAMISVLSPPDHNLLEQSSKTVYIESVVTIIPDFIVTTDGKVERPMDRYFILQKMGLNTTEEEEDEGSGNDDKDSFGPTHTRINSNDALVDHLRSEVTSLNMDIARLQGKLEVSERNYSDLLKKIDQLASSTNSLTSKTAMESLKQEDYPGVNFWTEESYNEHKEDFGDTDGLATQKPRRGRPSNDDDTQRHLFLEDELGNPVERSRVTKFSDKLRRLFNSLKTKGLDRPKWRELDEQALDYIQVEMETDFFEFRLCERSWKLAAWAPRVYASWRQNIRLQENKEAQSSTRKRRRSSTPQPSVSLDDSGLTKMDALDDELVSMTGPLESAIPLLAPPSSSGISTSITSIAPTKATTVILHTVPAIQLTDILNDGDIIASLDKNSRSQAAPEPPSLGTQFTPVPPASSTTHTDPTPAATHTTSMPCDLVSAPFETTTTITTESLSAPIATTSTQQATAVVLAPPPTSLTSTNVSTINQTPSSTLCTTAAATIVPQVTATTSIHPPLLPIENHILEVVRPPKKAKSAPLAVVGKGLTAK
ncbi:hypothetical protein C0993_008975 [Termitomyces sp. T159_Od127]|nr:hypothetical protein C0993_008975 [Termitomyces sp. T159_Od127]